MYPWRHIVQLLLSIPFSSILRAPLWVRIVNSIPNTTFWSTVWMFIYRHWWWQESRSLNHLNRWFVTEKKVRWNVLPSTGIELYFQVISIFISIPSPLFIRIKREINVEAVSRHGFFSRLARNSSLAPLKHFKGFNEWRNLIFLINPIQTAVKNITMMIFSKASWFCNILLFWRDAAGVFYSPATD